jgi:hypothetical protein
MIIFVTWPWGSVSIFHPSKKVPANSAEQSERIVIPVTMPDILE